MPTVSAWDTSDRNVRSAAHPVSGLAESRMVTVPVTGCSGVPAGGSYGTFGFAARVSSAGVDATVVGSPAPVSSSSSGNTGTAPWSGDSRCIEA